jgi:prepilin signal peptidase PulO-like enzyme (type II secretory pathway)
MLPYIYIEIGVLVFFTLIYAIFDVFNNRNVPNAFVYFTIIVGIIVALLAYRGFDLFVAFSAAAAICLLGYLLYRSGMLGAGDVLELAFISLVMPVQLQPFYNGAPQFSMPFVLSVIIAAGYTSLLFIPIYYIGIKKAVGRPSRKAKRTRTAGIFFAVYVAFIVALKYTYGLSVVGALLILLLAAASAIVMVYEDRIYRGMVELIYPNALEEGDMIATNLMSSRDIAYFNKRAKFGRLATKKLILDIKNIRKRIPVYRDSVPFSLFIFIGVIISLLFGNLILAVITL